MNRARNSAIFSLAYFAVYFTYLWNFINIENEWLHWVTLVSLPAAGLWIVSGAPRDRLGLHQLLASVRLSRIMLGRGLWWAFGIGIALGTSQVMLSHHRLEIWSYLINGKFVYAFPAALFLMLVTAGFTEEFFFRGVLQSRLGEWLRSKMFGNLAASMLFGLYHLPYAFLKTSWPSHGNLGAAIAEGVLPSAVVGFILGAVYNRTGNLLAPVIVHSCFNAVWAMTMI